MENSGRVKRASMQISLGLEESLVYSDLASDLKRERHRKLTVTSLQACSPMFDHSFHIPEVQFLRLSVMYIKTQSLAGSAPYLNISRKESIFTNKQV